jgi:hypothetical protein
LTTLPYAPSSLLRELYFAFLAQILCLRMAKLSKPFDPLTIS